MNRQETGTNKRERERGKERERERERERCWLSVQSSISENEGRQQKLLFPEVHGEKVRHITCTYLMTRRGGVFLAVRERLLIPRKERERERMNILTYRVGRRDVGSLRKVSSFLPLPHSLSPML